MVRRWLVTGGAGFIGQYGVDLLAGRGSRVRVLDSVVPQPAIAGVEYITGLILDREAIHRAMHGVDRVFHLAANPDLL